MSVIASSALSMILIVVLGFHFVLYLVALMVSILSGHILNLCMRSCNGVRCHLTRCFAEFRTGLYNGCVGGSVAKRSAALCLILSTRI